MFYDEMTASQRAELALFEERLLRAGWEIEPISTLLHSGTSVRPEGSADFAGRGGNLGVDFDVSDRLMNLLIEGEERRLQFHIVPGDSIESVLDWLTTYKDDVTPFNFARYLRLLIPVCRDLVFLTPDGKKYRITLEALDQDLNS